MGSTEQNWDEWNTATPAAADPSGTSADRTESEALRPGVWTGWNSGTVPPDLAATDTDLAAAAAMPHAEDGDEADDAWLPADIGIDPSAGFDTGPGYDMGAN